MPNFDTHFNGGAVSGMFTAVTTLISAKRNEKITLGDVVASAIIGGLSGSVGGVLPDLLEPATHPNHRGVMHSSLALVGAGSLPFIQSVQNTDLYSRIVINSFSIGYVSHLIMDASTPKSLPF